jgi:hypothetical protein
MHMLVRIIWEMNLIQNAKFAKHESIEIFPLLRSTLANNIFSGEKK